ncbi:MAG: glycosyltransferase family 2 protein [Candidatus Cloacimonadota bacterium]|nr:glycosyltransferase family 2 protein [Candidatus Cloacimonadota bacterium]
MLWAKIIFGFSALCLFYIFLGYPILISILSKIFPYKNNFSQIGKDEYALPSVSLLIPAYNEEQIIEDKIRNILDLDYPSEKLEMVIASDGSDDKTNEIVKNYFAKVKLIEYKKREGKTTLLNKTVPKLKNEIIVFSDASAMLNRDAIKKVVSHFQDESIGSVSGKYLVFNIDDTSRTKGEGIYWKYETYIKRCESKYYSILGAHGALYALRKKLFKPLPIDAINDDYILPMYSVEQGFRAVYDSSAISEEFATTSIHGEIKRRIRISVGNFQQLFLLKSLLNPFKGRIAFEFLSHKFLRSFSFVFFISLFYSNLFIIAPVFHYILFLQILFYLSSLLGFLPAKMNCKIKIFTLPFYIFLITFASLLGFYKFLFGEQKTTWEKSDEV